MAPIFVKLNQGWNAEPNSPEPTVSARGGRVVLRFALNHFTFDDVGVDDIGCLAFASCSRYRLGRTNDEGWYRGQCRYTATAPSWGEFYELCGDDPLRDRPDDWRILQADPHCARHFLFYLRDETYECIALDWTYSVERKP